MKILSHVSSTEDYKFIKKFTKAFNNNGIICNYVVTNLESWLRLKANKEIVSVVRKINNQELFVNSFNTKVGYLSDDKAAGDTYNSFISWLEINYKKEKWDIFIIPSGRMISHQALTDFANKYNIKTVYIGYGNFPGKTILDPIGTDKKSSLYTYPEVLDGYNIENHEYEIWRCEYLKYKENDGSIPQARNLNIKFIFRRFLRTIVCKIDNSFGIAHDIDYKFRDLDFFGFFKNKDIFLNFKDINEETEPYAFFAMQLSTDTQIIQNYSNDIYHALNVAIDKAKSENVKLIVKPHPAEISVEISKFLQQLEIKGIISLTNSNTISIIKNAEFVMVVNSTVGLEAKILRKKVIFLGDTFFSHLDEKKIRSYLLGYLYNIDYFSDESVTDDEFIKIRERLF